MYRVMIIDDEIYVANSLRDYLVQTSGSKYDVYATYSGQMALEMMESYNFDIVITDICMPDMDGLDLMCQIRSLRPSCRTILMSGYDNFDYIYKAMKQGGFTYILKSEVYNLVINEMDKAVIEIERELHEVLVRINNDFAEGSHGDLWTKAFNDLVDRTDKFEKIQKTLQELNFPIDTARQIYPVLFRFSSHGRLITELNQCAYLCGKISMLAKSMLGCGFLVYTLTVQPQFTVMLVQLCIDSDAHSINFIRGFLDRLQIVLSTHLSTDADLAAPDGFIFFEELTSTISRLKNTIYGMPYMGGGLSFIALTDRTLLKKHNPALKQDNSLLVPLALGLGDVLADEDADKADAYINQFVDYMNECSSMHCTPAIEVYMIFATSILAYINKHNLNHMLALRVPLYKLFQLNEFKSWSEALNYLTWLTRSMLELRKTTSVYDDLVMQIMQYIETHIEQDLSLIMLASYAGYNASYLSRYFHKETGITLSKFIVDKRVEHACSLLADPSLKVNKIAERMGFSSSNYFHSFFRKATGKTPQTYRDGLCTV